MISWMRSSVPSHLRQLNRMVLPHTCSSMKRFCLSFHGKLTYKDIQTYMHQTCTVCCSVETFFWRVYNVMSKMASRIVMYS